MENNTAPPSTTNTAKSKEQLEKVRAASQANNLTNTVKQQVDSKVSSIKSKYVK